jgi:hypothetical protein
MWRPLGFPFRVFRSVCRVLLEAKRSTDPTPNIETFDNLLYGIASSGTVNMARVVSCFVDPIASQRIPKPVPF